ncbi:hypothetical protein BaRGS_00008642 [Batillaria attramentaria]|uniref:Uncharacterized protein n=1 Tax=Batillaria attramentaria TaxID=370345 RepID=A0ABD0LKW8_9CAEN
MTHQHRPRRADGERKRAYERLLLQAALPGPQFGGHVPGNVCYHRDYGDAEVAITQRRNQEPKRGEREKNRFGSGLESPEILMTFGTTAAERKPLG